MSNFIYVDREKWIRLQRVAKRWEFIAELIPDTLLTLLWASSPKSKKSFDVNEAVDLAMNDPECKKTW